MKRAGIPRVIVNPIISGTNGDYINAACTNRGPKARGIAEVASRGGVDLSCKEGCPRGSDGRSSPTEISCSKYGGKYPNLHYSCSSFNYSMKVGLINAGELAATHTSPIHARMEQLSHTVHTTVGQLRNEMGRVRATMDSFMGNATQAQSLSSSVASIF